MTTNSEYTDDDDNSQSSENDGSGAFVEPRTPPGLHLVATPIGNLEDITLRALRVLREADAVLCEDTRHSRILLDHYGIRKHLLAYHDFNKESRAEAYLQKLRDGERLALICDAGTPGIADPAYNLVKSALGEGLPVFSVPGPSAVISALVASGLPTDRFAFENFLPKKSAQRLRKFEELKVRWNPDVDHVPTVVFYATPYQIRDVLEELGQVFGPELHVVLAREMTKKFEEYLRGDTVKLRAHYAQRTPKGEFVLLFHPQNKR